ncbi:MAG: DUF1830 domain-containing protein [Cyanobacteria bacterium P01_F01_bin.42]
MSQILDPIPDGNSDYQMMCYVNATSSIQVARITNVSNWYFERVVFPGQRLVFEAPLSANLEIHTGMMASAILSDTIPCNRLVMAEQVTQSKKVRENQQVIEYQNEGVQPNKQIEHIPKGLIKDLKLGEAKPKVTSVRPTQRQDKAS